MALDEKRKYLRSYRWSSYPGYLSHDARMSFLQVEEVLGYFGGDTAKGRRKYEDFVMEGITGMMTSPLERGKGHGIVGGSEFIEKIKGQYIGFGARLRELPAVRKIVAQVEPKKIIRIIGEVYGVGKEELLRKRYRGVGRSLLMEMLYRYGGMNQREIGELLGIDYSAVSVMRRRLSELQEKDRNLSAEIEKVKKRIQLSQE
jgi:hypothetical protein